MNPKVIVFVFVVFLFVGGLTYVEIKRFNTLTGYSSNEGNNIESKSYISAAAEVVFLIILFLFLSFVIKFIFNYHENVYNRNMDAKYNYSKKLIPLDLSHPRE